MDRESVRVLVVDDLEDAARGLAIVLELDGYTVRTASNGLEALEVLKVFTPLCVLMDIQMPTLGGHELCERLREQYGDELVLIAVTGVGSLDDRVGPKFSRFDHYLRKPVDLALLRRLLPPVLDIEEDNDQRAAAS